MSGWISIGEPEPQALTPTEKRVKEMLDKGYHYKIIAMALRMSHDFVKDTIYEIRKKEGIMRRATITDDEKQTMKRMFAEGKTIAEIAEATGRGTSSVDRIVKNRKPAQINPEFEAATDQMIAEMRAEKGAENDAAELEDVENGIPNLPLMPEIASPKFENAEEKSANAEPKFENAEEKYANAEEWRLPLVVQAAVDRYIADTTLEIEQREERIDELKEEVAIERAKLQELIEFRRKYREKVDAAEVLT